MASRASASVEHSTSTLTENPARPRALWTALVMEPGDGEEGREYMRTERLLALSLFLSLTLSCYVPLCVSFCLCTPQIHLYYSLKFAQRLAGELRFSSLSLIFSRRPLNLSV